MAHGRARPFKLRTAQHDQSGSGAAAVYLPVNMRAWRCLMEDMMRVPCVAASTGTLIQQCAQHDDWARVCMDPTIRRLMRVNGKAVYWATRSAPKAAPLQQVRGRATNAPSRAPSLGLWDVMPNLGTLCLGTVHLALAYTQAF